MYLANEKEFFKAEHDIWTIATRIMNERKKRELVPAKKMVQSIRTEKLEENNDESKHIQQTIADMDDFLGRIDQLSELMLKAEKNIIFKKMITLLK